MEHANWMRNLLASTGLPSEQRGNVIKKWMASLTSIEKVIEVDIADFAIEVWNSELEAWEMVPVEGALDFES
jgi:hypothetical protein